MFFQKKWVSGSIALCCFFCSLSVHSIGLSTFRIYLDQDQSNTAFTIYNRNTLPQDCKLKLIYYKFDDNGQMAALSEDEELPANNAHNRVRFSPKNFILSPANSQTVKFTLRRRAKQSPQEYRSYLAIDCGVEIKQGENKNDTDRGQIALTPKLQHNVPLIVRTGRLEAEVSFANIDIENNKVKFDLTRKGTRSVFGNLAVVEKLTDKVVTNRKLISVYTETSSKPYSLGLGDFNPEQVYLRFSEDTRYGGDLVITQDLGI